MRHPLRATGRRIADLLLLAAAACAASPWLGAWFDRLDLMAQFLIQAALVTAALLLLLVLLRSRRRAIIAALCLAMQVAALRPPLPGAAAAEGARIRIVALNVWVRNPERERTLAYLRSTDADVLVLSEIYEEWRKVIGSLADLYPYRADCLDQPGCDVVILSRGPMVGRARMRDPKTAAPYVEAQVRIGQDVLTVAGTHLVRPITSGSLDHQVAQVRYVGRRLAGRPEPRLLLGDFNAVGWGRVMRTTAQASGMRLIANVDGTWPAGFPWPLRLPIDNVLASPDIEVLARRNGPAVGSDHRPVVIDLRLREP
jgi:endonuclease/exonuclease/phosphatase (EEP) superfamily protein YafD